MAALPIRIPRHEVSVMSRSIHAKLACFVAAFAAVSGCEQAAPTGAIPETISAKTVEAERIVLTDGKGGKLAILQKNPQGDALFVLLDRNGKWRAQISIAPEPDGAAYIRLSDEDNQETFRAPPGQPVPDP